MVLTALEFKLLSLPVQTLIPILFMKLLRLAPPALVLAMAAMARADVVINEIMYHPSSESTVEEYVELHNTGPSAVNVAGWRFTNGVTFTIPPGTPSLPVGGYLVVAADAAAFTAKYPGVTNYVGGWTGRLSNSANRLELQNAAGVVMDEVAYADDGDWGVRERDEVDEGHRGWRWRSDADGFGKSLELIRASFDNSLGQNWKPSTVEQGTPGAANSVAAANIAPVVLDVAHFPLVPTSAETVTVNATVLDDAGDAVNVQLHYRNDGAADWQTIAMFDDGQHADGLAGDHIYGGQIPVQASGTIVEFYLAASDGPRSRTWPAPVMNNAAPGDPFVAEQTMNCLYEVSDTAYGGAMPIYRMVMTAADRAVLTSINNGNGRNSKARFNTTFVTRDGSGTELRYQCLARNRGHGSATAKPQSLRLGIPNDRDWRGRTALNFNSQYPYLQILGSAFMRKTGLPAPETRQIQLRVNGVDPTNGSTTAPSYGFYACVEVIDSDFAEHHFPLDDGGNVYSVRRTDAGTPDYYKEGDLTYFEPGPMQLPPDPYRSVYFKDTNESEDNWDDLISLTQAFHKGQFTTLTATPTWEADYVSAIQAKVDVPQWMRWFAAEVLLGNSETNLARGYGDDYYLYLGLNEPRARLIPWDLDTILGAGDAPAPTNEDLFRMVRHTAPEYDPNTPTPLLPFMRHPEFSPLYFQQLDQLLKGPFSVANFNALVDQTLTGMVSANVINARKTWFATRHAFVDALIPRAISVTSAPAVNSGYPRTLTNTCNLVGRANVLTTASVKVNGVEASYLPWRVTGTGPFTSTTGEWSINDVALVPGINRILIQSFDGTGAETERLYFDVWYNDGDATDAPATIIGNVTWTAANGPYVMTADMNVQSGATLTIEPGTTVLMGTGATNTVDIIVANGGRILAEGTELQPIRFLREPGSTVQWAGIDVNGAVGSPLSIFRHCTFEQTTGYAIDVNAGNVEVDYCYFSPTCADYLSLDGASFLVSNCIFPTPNVTGEVVHGTGGVRSDGRGIMRDCFFGKLNEYQDVFDFTGGDRPGPILQFINNVCVGSDDDILDLDGTDAWVEGNLFMHVHRNGLTPDSASAVSGGEDGGRISHVTIVGNLFYDVDHATTGKEGNFYTVLNNTIVDQNGRGSLDTLQGFTVGVFNLRDLEPSGLTGAGAGHYIEGNIIHSALSLARYYNPADSTVTFNNNLLPPGMTWSGPGSGNVSADPQLVDIHVDPVTGASNIPTPTEANFRYLVPKIRAQFGLSSRSLGLGTGPNGTDKGGVRPFGVSLGGAPKGVTNATTATITVGTLMTGNGISNAASAFPQGSGWTHYKWRRNGGAWSADTPIATPLSFTGLLNGVQTVDVVGRNDAGYYQDHADFGPNARMSTVSWTVNTAYVPPPATPLVRINEVLASNTETVNFGTQFPDIIELYNAGNATANLKSWGISDNAATPYKFTFATDTFLAPGAYLVVYASNSGSVPQPRTSFGIGKGGDDLTLTRSPLEGGGVADTVVWGQQLDDYSIGRAVDGSWTLCQPSFGGANVPARAGDLGSVRINEWLADAVTLFANDFVELYNPSQNPVDVGGCTLSNNPTAYPNKHTIVPLTFIRGGGFLSFKADEDVSQGPDHLNFRLSPLQGEIGLFAPSGALIDEVVYGPQTSDISQGRSPDGGNTVLFFGQPSPGSANPFDSSTTNVTTETTNVMVPTKVWKYRAHASAAPPNDAQDRPFTDPLYDDAAWPSGGGVLYIENSPFPANTDGFAKTTVLPGHSTTRPYQTYYFRTHFNYAGTMPGPNTTVTLRARVMCDDGAVFYLNGNEITPRLRMDNGVVGYSTRANGSAPDASDDDPPPYETIVLTATGLVQGDNVLAVSVHQVNNQGTSGGSSSDITWGMKLDVVATTTTVTIGTPVVLNEVLPVNQTLQNPDGSFAGWIELYNTGETDFDISDFSLSHAIGEPRQWVVPPGTVVPGNGYLVIHCNPLLAPGPANTGFSLHPAGDQVYFFKSLAQGGGLHNSVVFGQQVPDFSLARTPSGSGPFALGVPTRGALNTAAATASVSNVKLNEWVTNPVGANPSWFELYNTAGQPVLLSGNYLTDQLTNRTKFLVPPLTFVGGAGGSRWLQFIADNDSSAIPNHVNFSLSAGEGLGLYNAGGVAVDTVTTTIQVPGNSQGRFQDGASAILTLSPTPGAPNEQSEPDADNDGIPDAWELANGLNPNLFADAALDADGDGQNSLQEYLAGTNPQQPNSRLVAEIELTGLPGQYAISFTAVAGHSYTVRYKNNIAATTWTKLQDISPPPADVAVTVNDTPPAGTIRRVYQVVTPAQP